MKLIILVTLLVIVIFNICNSCPNYPDPIEIDENDEILQNAFNEIDEMIQSKMKTENVKSFIATIVYMDKLIWSKSYGYIDPLKKSPKLTIDSNFRIASITKSFTTLMLYKLRDQGIIRSLDDNIQDYLPQFKIKTISNIQEKVTFRSLASHCSNLPKETPCERDEYGTSSCTDEIIFKRLSNQFLISKNPYTIPHYSNLGVSLLGRALGESLKINGSTEQKAYESYVLKDILEPLGMKNTLFDKIKLKLII